MLPVRWPTVSATILTHRAVDPTPRALESVRGRVRVSGEGVADGRAEPERHPMASTAVRRPWWQPSWSMGATLSVNAGTYWVLDQELEEGTMARESLRILAIGAHLDDIELGCGGSLARAVRSGHCVHMICLSDSSYTNFDGSVLRTREEARREGQAAADALGCEKLEVLDFPTKDIPDDSRVVEALDERISEFRPDLIFTHWPFDTHQAHRGTALATIAAARRNNTILMYDPVFPSGRSFVGFRPQVYIDITDAIDGKLESLRCHDSQYRKYGDQWIDAVQSRARFRGYEMGTTFAEAFEVVRMEMHL